MRRDPPRVEWPAVLIGGAVATLVGIATVVVATLLSAPVLSLWASPVGLTAGGAVAGRISGHFGLLQGGMVAVLWIVAEALAASFEPQAEDVVADLAVVLLADAGRLTLAGVAGWIGARSAPRPSSAGTGRGR